MNTKSTTVRDVFLHLLSIVALYLTSFALGRLLFSIVNIYFPDALRYHGDEYGALRFSIASIIVVLPFYFFVTRFLVRIRQSTDYQDVRIRKWLIYLTLSLAAIAIVIDLVTLLYWFLGGDLTIQFLLKVAAVLCIAAAVFYYYFWELNARVPMIRIFVSGVLVVIAGFVVFGFIVIGSPSHRRAVRFDERRVQDLQSLQSTIVNYWQQKRALPIQLDDLKNDISGFVPPSDPETSTAYEYHVIAPLQFELCATFVTTGVEGGTTSAAPLRSMKPMAPYPHDAYADNWAHGVGHSCFLRTIDPELYPPMARPMK